MIEARASKIEDPIAKLRFLKDTDKRVGGVEKALGRSQYWWLRSGKLWLAIGFLLMIPTMSLFRSQSVSPRAANANVLPQVAGAPVVAKARPEAPLEKVYLVDSRDGIESWSNGLHVQTRYATSNRPREYYVWNRKEPNSTLTQLPSRQPAGIVFHTTESTLEELEEQKLRRLKLLGQSLLSYVQKEKAYHYVIDRFGRVYRIVAETDAANHAGKSTWADDQWAYIGLNDSFLAISFETQTRPGDEAPIISQAQVDSGRMLTRMLRSRYGIKAQNCVTHAQVSINPSNWQIGYHTDWAGNFPFEAMGLPDNYAQPLGSLYLFGFNYDGTFFAATGARMWNGVVVSEDLLRERAQQESISVAQLKNQLRSQYRRLSALLPEGNKASASAEADSNSREETK